MRAEGKAASEGNAAGVVGVVFCGGCNPQIDRKQILCQLYQMLPEDCRSTKNNGTGSWDLGIMLCGCAAACVDRPAMRDKAREWIVVAGSHLECQALAENQIPEVLAQTILDRLSEPRINNLAGLIRK